MFSRVFSIVMTPALTLAVFLATGLYLGNLAFQLANGEILAAVLWFVLWGHILSTIIAALVVFPVLAVLGVLAGTGAWIVEVGLKMQHKGVESLPFKVERKDTPLEEEGIEQMLDRLYLKIRQDAQADPSLPWREH